MSISSIHPCNRPWYHNNDREPFQWLRIMSGSERAMQRHWDTNDADGEVCIGVNFTSPLKVEEMRDRAREALNKLRFVSPTIACTMTCDDAPQYVYTPSIDREAWLDLAFAVEERGPSLNVDEFVQSINLKRLPYTDGKGIITYFKVYLLTTSKKGESEDEDNEYGLYFHGPHTIIDAGPALHGLNLMCEWISGEGMDVKIEHSEEWKNLAVDPVTATGGTSDLWPTVGTALLQEFLDESARTTPSCHTLPPPTLPLNLAHPLVRYTISTSESETAALVAATRKLGVSVSALLHAAHCLAQHKMNPVPEGTEVDFSPDLTVVNLERYIKPPINPKTHFITSFTLVPLRFSMTPVLKEPTEKARLIRTAKILQERFDRYLANPCLPHLFTALQDLDKVHMEEERRAGKDPNKKEAGPMPWVCAFNNLGDVGKKLKTQHGKITVQNICLGNRLRNFMTTHIWTIHSKLYFQIQGATAWGEEYIKTMLEETRRIGLLVQDDS